MRQRHYIDLQEGVLKTTDLDDKGLTALARSLRLIAVRGYLSAAYITEEQALEILCGALTPGDGTTIVDDSHLLHATGDAIKEAIYGHE